MKPGYTIIGCKFGNITNASNGATPKAYAAIRKGMGSVRIYMGQRTALKSKELNA